ERAGGEDKFVVCGKRRELVGMGAERKAGELSNLACGFCSEFRMRVEAGADGGATDGEIVEAVEGDSNAAAIAVQKIHVAGKFLAESEGREIGRASCREGGWWWVGGV